MSAFEAVIGLEVHAQLSTESKIFSSSGTSAGQPSNTLCDPVTLGLPGCLPALNRRVVDYAIKLGLATNCQIAKRSIFARKHYHYPDLPKGYQISQFEEPICLAGHLDIETTAGEKRIGITRIHLEEDAGKSMHLEGEPFSLVDLNRAGTPLVEIVSEPDMRTPEEAAAYMKQIHQIVTYLDVCDGNMEEGSLRCDANVSIRPMGQEAFGVKVEIKNLNSFRFVERAIAYEINRQTALVQAGEKISQETRLWDETQGSTKLMRSKEEAEDYRYFPDPDLLPLIIDENWIVSIKNTVPELPHQVRARFQSNYGLDKELAETLTEERTVSQYMDRATAIHPAAKSIANWISTELFGRLNRENIAFKDCPVSPENLGNLVRLIEEGTISGKIAKKVFEEMFSTGATPDSIIESRGLKQISDPDVIGEVVSRICASSPEQVEAYRGGQTKILGHFVGMVMKETKGKANPKLVNELLLKELEK